jgi:hypothetical protein
MLSKMEMRLHRDNPDKNAHSQVHSTRNPLRQSHGDNGKCSFHYAEHSLHSIAYSFVGLFNRGTSQSRIVDRIDYEVRWNRLQKAVMTHGNN